MTKFAARLPEDVSNFEIGVAPVRPLYALETPALNEALGNVRRSAHSLREVLVKHKPKPERDPIDESSARRWLDYLYVLDEVLPADDGLLERFRWLPIITDRTDSDVPAYSSLSMHRKRPQVLEVDLKCSEIA